MKGFKEFILRGNVIDLAVAVVIGAAFTALVAAFTSSLIQPVLALFGGADTGSIGFYLNPNKPETYVNISAILNAVITFLITAAVVYFVFVLPVNTATKMDRKRRGLPPEEETPVAEDIALLTEIHDALQTQNQAAATDQRPQA